MLKGRTGWVSNSLCVCVSVGRTTLRMRVILPSTDIASRANSRRIDYNYELRQLMLCVYPPWLRKTPYQHVFHAVKCMPLNYMKQLKLFVF